MNRFLSDIELASLGLALVVFLISALLGYREWLDRQGRPTELGSIDRAHFARRDRRRSLGLSILCLLALGIVVGSRTPLRVGFAPNPFFLGIWLAIFGLILALLALALVDWFDLRRYALRKKQAIGREHLAIIRGEIDDWRNRESQGDAPAAEDQATNA